MVNVTTGKVIIEVNSYNYTADIVGGIANLTIALPVGKYNATVYYLGDAHHGSCKNTSAEFIVSKLNTTIKITGGNSTYGDNANIIVTVDSGVEGNITIKLNNTQQTTITEKILGGKAVFNLPKLAAGNYTVNVVYNGNANYNINTQSGVFEVKKANPDLMWDLSPFQIYENATVSVMINDEIVNEVVNITISGVTYTLFVNNPSGVNSIRTNVISDFKDHTIELEYYGNENYTGVKYNFSRTPTKITTYGIKINANNIIVGDDNIIAVEVPNHCDDVVIWVNGHRFRNHSFTNNKAIFNITGINLKEGIYTVTSTVNDAEFDHKNFTVIVTVNKTPPPMNITVINQSSLHVGQTVKVIVSVPRDVKENVTIMIDGMKYSKKPVGGNATFELKDLASGDKTITAIYNGDDKYRLNATTANFTVSKLSSHVNITVNQLYYVGQSFNITVDNDTVVNVTINGKVYTIVNGNIIIDADELPAGHYIITAAIKETLMYCGNITTKE